MAESNATSRSNHVKDITGKRFGKLTAIAYSGSKKSGTGTAAMWLCQCDCGNTVIRHGGTLRASGPNAHCGCNTSAWNKKHGKCRSKIYGVWRAMLDRCYGKNCKAYPDYGGRGIAVCEEWKVSFESFYADMGDRPTPSHTIERINTNGDYYKENCRWATRAEQMRNTRRTRILTLNGRSQCLADWAKELGVKRETIKDRLTSGWSVERALTTPVSRRGGA